MTLNCMKNYESLNTPSIHRGGTEVRKVSSGQNREVRQLAIERICQDNFLVSSKDKLIFIFPRNSNRGGSRG